MYVGKWSEKANRMFTPEEIACVDVAKVVSSQYGLSVCFMMKGGGQTYIPLDHNSGLMEGDNVDLNKATLVTLQKQGEEDIYRVRM